VKDRIVINNPSVSEGTEHAPLVQGDIGKFKNGWEMALENYVR
jgi:hypothetical protein